MRSQVDPVNFSDPITRTIAEIIIIITGDDKNITPICDKIQEFIKSDFGITQKKERIEIESIFQMQTVR